MFCTKCGSQVPDGTAFCTKCGNPLKKNEPVQINTPQAPSININLNQNQKTESSDYTAPQANVVNNKVSEIKRPNRVVVAIVTLLFGWFGIHNLVWGKKIFGFVQLIIFIFANAVYNENFGLNLITWILYTILCGWLIFDSVRILNGKFFNHEKETNNIAIMTIIWYGFCSVIGLWLIFEGVDNLTMNESDSVYSMEEIEKAFSTPYENTEKFIDSKYTIVGTVKGSEIFTDLLLEVSGTGPIKSVGLDFFQSEKDKLQKYTAGSKISAYCIGRGLEDGKFTAEYCRLK